MEITGKIAAVLEKKTGTSQNTGNTWQRQEFVIEFASGSYYKKIAMTINGENVDRFAPLLVVGQKVTVKFDINAREWQGRWFNEVSVWSIQADNSESNAAVTTEHDAVVDDPFSTESQDPMI